MKTIQYTDAKFRQNPQGIDAIFYVLEGVGIVEVGDEQLEVTKDTLIESPAKIPKLLV